MHGIIAQLLNCSIVKHQAFITSKVAKAPDLRLLRGGTTKGKVNNLTIQQFNNRAHRGFTLIELIIVIAILGILATGILTIINVGGTLNKADIAKAKIFSKSIESNKPAEVGKWSFEDGTGATVFKDSSRFKNDGSCTSCPAVQDEDACGLGFGGCLKFDGVNNYANTTSPISLGNFTASYWIKTTQVGDTDSNWYGGKGVVDAEMCGPVNDWGTALIDGGKIAFGIGNPDTTIKSSKEVNDGKWHHVAVTRVPAGALRIYIDGSLDKSGTHSNANEVGDTPGACGPPVSPTLGFGNSPWNNSQGVRFFNGFIDEVSIYNESFTAYQIRELYGQGAIKHLLTKW